MSVATLANATYTVERQTVTRDALGGQVRTWAQVLSLDGRVQPRGGTDQVFRGREEELVTHRGYFAGTPDVRVGDRIVTSAGRRLYVLASFNVDYADSFLTVDMQERDS